MRSLTLFAAAAVGIAGIAGCDREPAPPPSEPPSGPASGDLAPREDGQSDPELRRRAEELLDRYADEVEELAEVLRGIDDRLEAVAASPEVKGIIDRMRDYRREFEAMAPEVRERARAEYESRLAPAVASVRQEAERLMDEVDVERLKEHLRDLPWIGG